MALALRVFLALGESVVEERWRDGSGGRSGVVTEGGGRFGGSFFLFLN